MLRADIYRFAHTSLVCESVEVAIDLDDVLYERYTRILNWISYLVEVVLIEVTVII